jgi:hypothetical protein
MTRTNERVKERSSETMRNTRVAFHKLQLDYLTFIRIKSDRLLGAYQLNKASHCDTMYHVYS